MANTHEYIASLESALADVCRELAAHNLVDLTAKEPGSFYVKQPTWELMKRMSRDSRKRELLDKLSYQDLVLLDIINENTYPLISTDPPRMCLLSNLIAIFEKDIAALQNKLSWSRITTFFTYRTDLDFKSDMRTTLYGAGLPRRIPVTVSISLVEQVNSHLAKYQASCVQRNEP